MLRDRDTWIGGRAWRATAMALLLAAMTAGVQAGESYVVRAKAIYPVRKGMRADRAFMPGVMLVRDGKIAAIGTDIDVPAGIATIDLRDAVLCPGFVSAATSLIRPHAGEHSISGAYQAIDAFDGYDEHPLQLATGLTTVHLDPGGHRLVSGRGAVVKLAGDHAARTLKAGADLAINFGTYDPPPVVDIPFYASSDVGIEPATLQGPDSRMGQIFAIEELIARGDALIQRLGDPRRRRFEHHDRAFVQAWRAGLRLRLQVRRAADIASAIDFVRRHERDAYFVGLGEADDVLPALVRSGLPLVVRIEDPYRFPAWNLGSNPEVYEPDRSVAATVARGSELPIALAGLEGDAGADLKMIAALAMRGGMSEAQALASITRIPAEILGVADRVGSLEAGKDADFLVLSGPPLKISSHVLRAYVGGREVFKAPGTDALVVKASTLWVGDGTVLNDGALLIEDGRIQAIGHRVPTPPFARVIDAGAGSFVTPGFIDAHSHLGLSGDNSAAGPEVEIDKTVAVAGREFLRVAREGITTVMLSAYRAANNGARVAAVKTYGSGRDDLVLRSTAGLKFRMGNDPSLAVKTIETALEAGKKYVKKWEKYEEELKKWQEAQAAGKQTVVQKEEEQVVEKAKEDPITGIWEFKVSGGPLPEEVSGTVTLKLTGSKIEGRLTIPIAPDEEVVLSGTLEGDQVVLEVEQETPFGNPQIRATLDREDHMAGIVALGDRFQVDFEATRTNKDPVEFKVGRRKRRGKDGRPLPPKVDQALEPYRAWIAGRIPAVIEVFSAAQASSVMEFVLDREKLPLVLLNASNLADIGDAKLKPRKEQIGVILPERLERRREGRPYSQAADLARKGVPVAFQSNAEDGGRNLPLMALFAVYRGMGGDNALRALTIDAARMYKIDDRVGSLEVGKDADVLIHSGHPFDSGSRVERVIVNGQEVPRDAE